MFGFFPARDAEFTENYFELLPYLQGTPRWDDLYSSIRAEMFKIWSSKRKPGKAYLIPSRSGRVFYTRKIVVTFPASHVVSDTLSDAAYALNGEFNSTGVDCVDMQDPMSTDSSLESGDIGTNEMEGITSPKFQQKWRF